MGNKKEINKTRLGPITSHILLLGLFLLVAYSIYDPAITSYFFQDDWFTFKISSPQNITEFIAFFKPRDDVIYYRPLGMQVYFFLMKYLFGFTSVYYRLSTLAFYSINGLLVYTLLKKLGFKKWESLCASLFYIVSVSTYIPFYWSATFPFVLSQTFSLSAIIFYIDSESQKQKFYVSYLLFIGGLLTLENAIIIPAIFFVWHILNNEYKKIAKLTLFLVPIIIIFLLRLFIFQVPLEGTYQPSIRLFSTLRTYALWSLNWPEEISRQMIGPFTIQPLFIRDFSSYVNIWMYISLGLAVLIFLPFINLFRTKTIEQKKLNRIQIFSLAWIILTITPLIMFSEHAFPYYLPLTLGGLSIFIAVQVSRTKSLLRFTKIQYLYGLLIIALYYINAQTTINFNTLVHWAPRRAQMAQYAIRSLQDKINPAEKTLVIVSEDYKYPLNDQDGLHVVYGDNISTEYTNSVDRQDPKYKNQNIIILE